MKRYTYLLPFLLLFGFLSCQDEDHSCCTKPVTASTKTSASHTSAITDMSVYNLESEWENQDGKKLKLEKMKGKPQVVAMIYTSCGYACPRTVADLKRIENGLAKYKQEDFGVTLVTMDPERDTPERLKEFAGTNSLHPIRWTLLTSNTGNIQELAVLLNMKYNKAANGDIAHSNIISVLNAQGEIVHQQEGLGTAPDATIAAIRNLLP